jgi:hypothetical protein
MSISWNDSGIASWNPDVFKLPENTFGDYTKGIDLTRDYADAWRNVDSTDSTPFYQSAQSPSQVDTGRSETTSKALEALNKALAYQGSSQSARTGGTTASAPSGRVEKINNSLSIIYPGQKQKVTDSGGGTGGLFGSIGQGAGLLGSALGVFGPLGAPIGALAGGLIDRAAR